MTHRPASSRARHRVGAVLAVGLLAASAAACQSATAGQRCSGGVAQDGTHLLVCQGGRWQRSITLSELGRIMAERAAADAAAPTQVEDDALQQTTTPPPTTTAAPTTTAPPTTTTTSTTTTTVPAPTVRVVAVGDMADCNGTNDSKVADVIRSQGVPLLSLGDQIQGDDPNTEYPTCYDPVFGEFRDRTYPTPGNHEYLNGAPPAAYLSYFGSRARPAGTTWYSFDLGRWHVVSLNANCGERDVGGCGTSSAQYRWLAADLAATTTPCLLAYWHESPFSSTPGYTGQPTETPMLQLLQSHGLDVLLGGHLHNYERFARLNASGAVDPSGFRAFVVGTGGYSHFALGAPRPGSEVRNDSTFGVLRLDLAANGFSWKFLPIAGASFTDSGADTC